VSKPYDYASLFLIFGLGPLAGAAVALYCNAITWLDFCAALFAAFIVLRISNTMQREDARWHKDER
jgi:hypothetical protein